MAAPVQLTAIDAGSNAIRLAVARATSPEQFQIIETERAAVRLGHNAFTRRLLNEETISRAARAFRHFRNRMDRHHVTAYRAVATAAAREARNFRRLLERIERKSGIELEVISSEEEARLVCLAVRWALGERIQPRVIFDLGGGSLEMNFFERGLLQHRIALPLGTIRLMETYSIQGAIDEDRSRRLQLHVSALLRSALPSPPRLARAAVVACGGNAETLARLAPGPLAAGTPTINLRLLRDQAWRVLELDVARRMKEFRVRRDRAEVMGIAAIVILTVGKWLGLRSLLVPGVGVREGVLLDLVAEQYSGGAASEEERGRAAEFLAAVRWFARRVNYHAPHAEQVSRLALSLFDQLRPLHEMGPEERLVLEGGALLHDIGHFIHRKAHHRHGEYLIRNSEIPGLRGWRRDMIAALVRYHNCKSEPQAQHASYASLDGARRRNVRTLTSLLRIAEKLESEHAERIAGVDVQIAGRRAIFLIRATEGTRLDIAGLERKAGLFEKEFQLKAEFRRAQRRAKVA
ncbi:MAG TPA: HD domain-containing protein [Candidatus Polarisedimenticolia bacterium]|nr:HD domain-containing protein [Candidatus Polarisedimenticolia bacterium]